MHYIQLLEVEAMQEARFYDKIEDQKVKCYLCAHGCVIDPLKRGICMVRENRDGTLYSLVYGKVISQNVDPIEKKPLLPFPPRQQVIFHCHRWAVIFNASIVKILKSPNFPVTRKETFPVRR